MSDERNPDDVFELLCSNHARDILVAATAEPVSAADLAHRCDISLPTVYRHVNPLVEQGLLEEQIEVDPEGNHYKRYASNLDFVTFELENSGFNADVGLRWDIVDRFGAFWQGLGPQTD